MPGFFDVFFRPTEPEPEPPKPKKAKKAKKVKKATGPKLVKILTKKSREALRQNPDNALTEEPKL